jgi:hypothetical protein
VPPEVPLLPEPPEVEPLPPEEPLVEVISTVEEPPDVEPLVPDVEPEPPLEPLVEPETRAGPPEELPLVPDVEVSRDDVTGPPERRFRLSSTSRHRRWVGRGGRAFRLAWGLDQRSFNARVKRISAIGHLSFEAGASRHRGGSQF